MIVEQLTYHALKKSVESAPLVAMQPEWFENICRLIPDHLKQSASLQAIMNELLAEVVSDFDKDMREITGFWFKYLFTVTLHFVGSAYAF